MRISRRLLPILLFALALAAVTALGSAGSGEKTTPAAGVTNGAAVMPAYDDDGRMLLPEGFERWVFAGSSLGLSYSEGSGGTEMFHHTLIEPTAYAHFARSGEFRDGTMLALLLHDTGESVLPQRRGRFAGEVQAVEMAVKDARFAEGWAYFGFTGSDGLRDRAEAFAATACQSCHVRHAAYDNVFVQFYPLLVRAAPAGSPARVALASFGTSDEETPAQSAETAEDDARLALRGLDPVHLAEGREELGKPEIVATHGGYRYRFISEPSRERFAADPARYAIQNESCPVVPGAAPDPDLYAVHDGKIYVFATENCVETFRSDPEAYLPADRPADGATDDA